MNRKILFCLILLSGFVPWTYAGTGNARDGMVFIFIVVVFLMILAALLWGIDYLRRNGKVLFRYSRKRYSRVKRAWRGWLAERKALSVSAAATS